MGDLHWGSMALYHSDLHVHEAISGSWKNHYAKVLKLLKSGHDYLDVTEQQWGSKISNYLNNKYADGWQPKPWGQMHHEQTKAPLELAMSKSTQSQYIFGSKKDTEPSDPFKPAPFSRKLLMSETAKDVVSLNLTRGAKNYAKSDVLEFLSDHDYFSNGKYPKLPSLASFSQSVNDAASQYLHIDDSPKQKAWMSPYDFSGKSAKPPKTLAKQAHYAH